MVHNSFTLSSSDLISDYIKAFVYLKCKNTLFTTNSLQPVSLEGT